MEAVPPIGSLMARRTLLPDAQALEVPSYNCGLRSAGTGRGFCFWCGWTENGRERGGERQNC